MAVIVEQVLRIRDEATAALNKAAQAARESASALNVTEEAAIDAGQAFDRGGASADGLTTDLDGVANAAKRAKTALDGAGASAGKMPGVIPGGAGGGLPGGGTMPTPGAKAPTDPFGPVGTSADKAAVSVGNLNQRAGSLVQQLMDVGVMLQGGMNPFTILVTQGPQIATALGGASTAAAVLKTVWAGLTATVGAILPFLGPIAVGIAAVTAAYSVGANAVDAYNDSNGRAGERLEMLQGKLQSTYDAVANVAQVYAQFAARQNEISDRIGVLTGSITASDAAYRKEAEAINIAYKAAVQADVQRLQTIALNAQLLRQQAATEMMLPGTRAGILAQAASYEAEAKAIKERVQAAKQSRDVSLDLADSERILKNEKEKSTQAEKSATKATKERNKELKDSAALFRGLEEALIAYNLAQVDAFASGGSFITPDTIGNLRTMQATLEQLIPQATLSRAEQLEMLLVDIALARSRDGGAANGALDEMESQIRTELPKAWADGVAEGLTEAEAGMRDFLDKMSQQLQARLARIGQVLGDAISGDLVSASQSVLSSAGPIGALLGGVMGGVQTLGQQGGKKTAKMAVEGLDSVIKGISNIPELLVQLIPRLITQTFPDLIVALVGILPKLAVAIVIELPVAIVRGIVRWWRDIGGFTGLVKNIAAGIRDWWTGVWDRIRAWFKDIFTPGNQSRGRGPSQKEQDRALRDMYSPGLASLREQQKEARDMQSLGRSRQTMRPFGLTLSQAAPSIVIQSDVVDVDAADRLARRLNRQFGTGGRRTNPVLGGA